MLEWPWLILAAASAGFVDAVVGGGGLVMLPALFTAFPNAMPAALLGSNKVSAVGGTTLAAWRYAQRIQLNWKSLFPALLTALLGSFLGAWLVTLVAPDALRLALPWILLLVLIYTVARKDLGRVHAPHLPIRTETIILCSVGFCIGAYDGFFGPGTGSFFMFALVRFLGYGFLQASANAKLLNMATNVSAIALFASKGLIWWQLALALAVANMVGSFIGSHFAMKHGSGFVRVFFLILVSALVLKTGYDGYFG